MSKSDLYLATFVGTLILSHVGVFWRVCIEKKSLFLLSMVNLVIPCIVYYWFIKRLIRINDLAKFHYYTDPNRYIALAFETIVALSAILFLIYRFPLLNTLNWAFFALHFILLIGLIIFAMTFKLSF